MRGRWWTSSETTMLAQMMRAGRYYSDIATVLDRSLSAVKEKVRRERRRGKAAVCLRTWTAADVAIIHQAIAEGVRPYQITQLPDRSYYAVRNKYRELSQTLRPDI